MRDNMNCIRVNVRRGGTIIMLMVRVHCSVEVGRRRRIRGNVFSGFHYYCGVSPSSYGIGKLVVTCCSS
ncbi:hypothetical protein BCR34DRAFT_568304 [Clohesyomyces aquaticus]|uniref:Uncharacterized protein n=1 Tax=Clohesyomyces aquaticus TaxID=1231657 RepID=A0A1Y1ZH34_9PLEO|nr:hypothetical protein BCR34DRAFT_568304 [Clohesyomyces aquaticus]